MVKVDLQMSYILMVTGKREQRRQPFFVQKKSGGYHGRIFS